MRPMQPMLQLEEAPTPPVCQVLARTLLTDVDFFRFEVVQLISSHVLPFNSELMFFLRPVVPAVPPLPPLKKEAKVPKVPSLSFMGLRPSLQGCLGPNS